MRKKTVSKYTIGEFILNGYVLAIVSDKSLDKRDLATIQVQPTKTAHKNIYPFAISLWNSW